MRCPNPEVNVTVDGSTGFTNDPAGASRSPPLGMPQPIGVGSSLPTMSSKSNSGTLTIPTAARNFGFKARSRGCRRTVSVSGRQPSISLVNPGFPFGFGNHDAERCAGPTTFAKLE